MRTTALAAAALALVTPSLSLAQVEVIGGSTSVALDTATLSSAASLNLSSVSPGIGGGLLDGSVAFPINARDAALLPTTFAYTAGDFPSGPFSGTIEHTGSVFFNSDTVEVGDFKIGFDINRVGGAKSGFFVESTTGVAAILFDTEVVALQSADDKLLDLTVNLLVSPEFAGFLQTNNLATSDLTGADVGDARVFAAVPEPASLVAVAVALGVGLPLRRRN